MFTALEVALAHSNAQSASMASASPRSPRRTAADPPQSAARPADHRGTSDPLQEALMNPYASPRPTARRGHDRVAGAARRDALRRRGPLPAPGRGQPRRGPWRPRARAPAPGRGDHRRAPRHAEHGRRACVAERLQAHLHLLQALLCEARASTTPTKSRSVVRAAAASCARPGPSWPRRARRRERRLGRSPRWPRRSSRWSPTAGSTSSASLHADAPRCSPRCRRAAALGEAAPARGARAQEQHRALASARAIKAQISHLDRGASDAATPPGPQAARASVARA